MSGCMRSGEGTIRLKSRVLISLVALERHRKSPKGSSARSTSPRKVAAMLYHPICAEQVVSLVVKWRECWHSAHASASFEFRIRWSIGDSNPGPLACQARADVHFRL